MTATPQPTSPRIFAAIAAVTEEVARQGIAKDRRNQQQGYQFRGIDDVMNVFGPALAKHRVLVLPSYSDREVTERATMKGGTLFVVTVKGTFRFVSTEDGSEISSGPFIGEASDSADKATNKAMAVAYKYALFQTFCVPLEGIIGGDPDGETHEVAAPKVKPDTGAEITAARERLRTEREGNGIAATDMLAYARSKGFGDRPGAWTVDQVVALTDWCKAGGAEPREPGSDDEEVAGGGQ